MSFFFFCWNGCSIDFHVSLYSMLVCVIYLFMLLFPRNKYILVIQNHFRPTILGHSLATLRFVTARCEGFSTWGKGLGGHLLGAMFLRTLSCWTARPQGMGVSDGFRTSQDIKMFKSTKKVGLVPQAKEKCLKCWLCKSAPGTEVTRPISARRALTGCPLDKHSSKSLGWFIPSVFFPDGFYLLQWDFLWTMTSEKWCLMNLNILNDVCYGSWFCHFSGP